MARHRPLRSSRTSTRPLDPQRAATPSARLAARGWGSASSRAACGILVGIAGFFAGCTGSLNDTNDLLGAPPLPALAGPLTEEELATAKADLAAGAPLTSLDRRAWTAVEISVPRGQVEHQPIYWTELMADRSTARARGEFPGAGTALEGDGEPWPVALEAGTNLASTPLFVLWAPVEMIAEGNWPWTTLRNRPDYARVPPPVARDDWAWVAPRSDSITGDAPSAMPVPGRSPYPPPDSALSPPGGPTANTPSAPSTTSAPSATAAPNSPAVVGRPTSTPSPE